MRVLKVVFASSLFILAAPSIAEEKAVDKNDPNAVRCKRLAMTGSLVRKERTCRTNAEWKKVSEQQNRDADDLITRSRAGMNPSG